MTTPIGYGARLTDPVVDGRTVLDVACEAGHEYIVRGVLEGAASPAPDDIAACQKHIASCAEIAAAHGHPDVLDALKDTGAIDAVAWQRVAEVANDAAVGWFAEQKLAPQRGPEICP